MVGKILLEMDHNILVKKRMLTYYLKWMITYLDDNILVEKWMITFVQDDSISREMDDNKVDEDDNIVVEIWMIT